MAVIELTGDNIESTIDSNDIVIIDFWAPWCGPCQAFKPIFEAAAGRHPEVVFAKCNTEEQQELAGIFGIRSIPTVMVFRDAIGIFAQPGMLPAEALDDLVSRVKALDMDAVREAVSKEEVRAAS